MLFVHDSIVVGQIGFAAAFVYANIRYSFGGWSGSHWATSNGRFGLVASSTTSFPHSFAKEIAAQI